MIVIGAPNSSNSLRLVEVAERLGTPAHLVQRGTDIDPEWLGGIAMLGITAGASAPEALVREVIHALAAHPSIVADVALIPALHMVFKLPRGFDPAPALFPSFPFSTPSPPPPPSPPFSSP